MAEKVRVGYMGIPHSNSEHMAKSFSDGLGLTDYKLVPLMSAKNVMDALVSGEIDYGVFATMNRYAGTVVETTTAMKGHSDIETMGSMWTHIHHCVFKKDANDRVTRLVSHIQALLQSESNLKRLYPDAVWEECEDTAYAAEMLSKGMLPEGSAAICRRDAGEAYGLYLDNENVEDRKENMTLFAFVRMKSADP